MWIVELCLLKQELYTTSKLLCFYLFVFSLNTQCNSSKLTEKTKVGSLKIRHRTAERPKTKSIVVLLIKPSILPSDSQNVILEKCCKEQDPQGAFSATCSPKPGFARKEEGL